VLYTLQWTWELFASKVWRSAVVVSIRKQKRRAEARLVVKDDAPSVVGGAVHGAADFFGGPFGGIESVLHFFAEGFLVGLAGSQRDAGDGEGKEKAEAETHREGNLVLMGPSVALWQVNGLSAVWFTSAAG